jgi:hypothetical protein
LQKILLWFSSILPFLIINNVNAELSFSDGFESGSFAKAQGGFAWGASRADPGKGGTSIYDLPPAVSSENPKTGKYSLKFTFGGSSSSASWSEKRFSFDSPYEDVWYKADLFYAKNFSPRDHNSAAHNKGPLLIWSGAYGGSASDQQMNYEAWNASDVGVGNMQLSYNPGPGSNNMGHFWPKPPVLLPDMSRDLGRWFEIIVHTKFASSANNDGVIEIWKDGKLVFSKYNLNNFSNIRNGVDQGYLFGWANTGFKETTHIYIDNVVFSNKPITPGNSSVTTGSPPPNPPTEIN